MIQWIFCPVFEFMNYLKFAKKLLFYEYSKSITNLRFIAVTQPLKYARHKNSNRIYFMLGIVWFVSIAVASPIVAGLNDTADRQKDQCAFNNETFLIYSSMFSFYIPTMLMVCLYYKIFHVIRARAIKSQAAVKARRSQPPSKHVPSATATTTTANTLSTKSGVDLSNGAKQTDTVVAGSTEACPLLIVAPSSNTTTSLMLANGEATPPLPSNSPQLLNKPSIAQIKKDETEARAKAASEPEKVHLISAGIFKLKHSKKLIASAANKDSEDQPSSGSCSESNSGLLAGSKSNTNLAKTDKNNNNNINTAATTVKSESSNNLSPQAASMNVLCVAQQQQPPPQNTATTVVSFAVEDPNMASKNSPHGSLNMSRHSPNTAQKAAQTSRFKPVGAGVLRAQSSAISAVSSNKERKVTKTLAIVLIVFLVCW